MFSTLVHLATPLLLGATPLTHADSLPLSDSLKVILNGTQSQDAAETQQYNQHVYSTPPVASPRDTVRATIGAAHVAVDYGRPSVRGREIFGGLVPYNQVWRTGANAATVFMTDKEVVLGGQVLPRGSYTLFTIPTDSTWTLIINREVGEWGLTYHPEFDFARVPMILTTKAAKDPIEKFLIDFTPTTMRFQWDKTVVEVPIAEQK